MMLLTLFYINFFLLLYFSLYTYSSTSDIKEFFHYLSPLPSFAQSDFFGSFEFGRKKERTRNLLTLCCGVEKRKSETWNCFYLKRLSDIREHHQRLNCFFTLLLLCVLWRGFFISLFFLSSDILFWSWKK